MSQCWGCVCAISVVFFLFSRSLRTHPLKSTIELKLFCPHQADAPVSCCSCNAALEKCRDHCKTISLDFTTDALVWVNEHFCSTNYSFWHFFQIRILSFRAVMFRKWQMVKIRKTTSDSTDVLSPEGFRDQDLVESPWFSSGFCRGLGAARLGPHSLEGSLLVLECRCLKSRGADFRVSGLLTSLLELWANAAHKYILFSLEIPI